MDETKETTELVHSMEDNKAFDYGTTDHCKGNSVTAETPASSSHDGHECSLNMSSADRRSMEGRQQGQVASNNKPCPCTVNDGICECGQKKKGIQLEPWAPMKSYALFSLSAIFFLWIIVFASLGAKNKL